MVRYTAVLCAAVVGSLISTHAAHASLIQLAASDALGQTSFTTGVHWTGGAAPTAGNMYEVGSGLLLRTPADANSYTFAGDSLQFDSGSFLLVKGGGAPVYTANWILNGGTLRSGAGSTDNIHFAGNIQVIGTGSTILADQSLFSIDAPITGSAPLLMNTSNPDNTVSYTITVNAANTYSGTLTYQTGKTISKLIFSATSGWTFNIGASGVNNAIVGTGAVAGSVTFDGAFNLNLAGASTTPGASWQLVGPGLTPIYGADFTIPGFTANGTTFSNGSYVFDETTGTLTAVSAVPEPASLSIAALGAVALLTRRRRA